MEKPATIAAEISPGIAVAQESDSKKQEQIVPLEVSMPEESFEPAQQYARPPIIPLREPANENRLCYEMADLKIKNGFSPDPGNSLPIFALAGHLLFNRVEHGEISNRRP